MQILHWGDYARLAYVFVLAFVFPFVCWGAEGSAGHLHRRAHLVFLMPETRFSAQPHLPQHDHAHMEHGEGQIAAPFQTTEAAGQSIPDTLTISLLLLLIGGMVSFLLYTPICWQQIWASSLGVAQTLPRLPLPPPRSGQA